MTTFNEVQQAFSLECTLRKEFPDLKDWIAKIRQAIPKGPVYVILHEYQTDSGKERDAFLLTTQGINWNGQKNDPQMRTLYFHKSRYDSNIWVLKENFRWQSNILKTLVLNKHFIY